MEHDPLLRAIEERTLTVGVIGLGAVGLPLARTFAQAGFCVLGFDTDAAKLARLARGAGSPAHLGPDFAPELLATGRFEATSDPERLREVGAALVCVPTPLDARGEPDLGPVLEAARTLARLLPRGALAVLESTVWPGATRGPFGAAFREQGRGDVLVAHSPEREDPGREIESRAIPKLVGGTCQRSARAAEALYAAAWERVVPVASAEVAEAAKLVENVYRAVNIALVDELKLGLHRLGIDVHAALDAAATKPFGFQRFAPGPGAGGHCIPIDPRYLAWAVRRAGGATPLVDAASAVHERMPAWVVERAQAALASTGQRLSGSEVLVLGLAYKRGVDITAESPALAILELLRAAGARARFHDPLVRCAPLAAALASEDRHSIVLDAASVERADLVLVATDQPGVDWDLVARHARLVVDARRALESRLAGDARYFPA